jgi:hypothetical protein
MVCQTSAARLAEMIRLETLRRWTLWFFIAISAIAAIEPSPYEFMFGVAVVVFARSGLRFDRTIIPMVVLLAMLNVGGLLALTPWVDERPSVMFVGISIYIALTAIFFAGLVTNDPGRLSTIRSGYVVAGTFAAILGIIGYFDILGLGAHFTIYNNSRATGPFKDANVFGPFLVPPIVWLVQDVLLKRRRMIVVLTPLLIMLVGLLLSLSRGAWGDVVASTVLLIVFTFMTTTSAALRWRIVVIAIVGAFGVVVLLMAVLSIPSMSEVLVSRASLGQEYDVGELGRFGAQLRSIPMLLELPFGFGPLRFETIFPRNEAPHEVYVNGFAAYGWLGGLSLIAFTGVTLYVGFRQVFLRSSFQAESVAIWASLLPQMVQGLQIDTDHWRHLFLMFGCLYGLASASRIESASRARALRQQSQFSDHRFAEAQRPA